jgi:hypothetical protein
MSLNETLHEFSAFERPELRLVAKFREFFSKMSATQKHFQLTARDEIGIESALSIPASSTERINPSG